MIVHLPADDEDPSDTYTSHIARFLSLHDRPLPYTSVQTDNSIELSRWSPEVIRDLFNIMRLSVETAPQLRETYPSLHHLAGHIGVGYMYAKYDLSLLLQGLTRIESEFYIDGEQVSVEEERIKDGYDSEVWLLAVKSAGWRYSESFKYESDDEDEPDLLTESFYIYEIQIRLPDEVEGVEVEPVLDIVIRNRLVTYALYSDDDKERIDSETGSSIVATYVLAKNGEVRLLDDYKSDV